MGGKVGVLAVFLDHLVLRFLLRLHGFFLRLLLLLVGLARSAGVRLCGGRRHRQVWQQGAETQNSENEGRADSLHRFLGNLSDSTTCWNSFIDYGSKSPERGRSAVRSACADHMMSSSKERVQQSKLHPVMVDRSPLRN